MPAHGYSQYRDEDDLPLSHSTLDELDDLPRVLRPTLETTEYATPVKSSSDSKQSQPSAHAKYTNLKKKTIKKVCSTRR